MEDTADYEKMVAMIDSADVQHAESSVSIDVSKALQNEFEEKELKFADVSGLLEGVKTEAAPEVQAQPKAQMQIPKHEIGGEMQGAASKLKEMTGGISKEFAESVSKEVEKAKEEGLIMPTLSLQDQLSDLEKIEEGLGAGVFDKDQIKIIVQEVTALSSIAAHEGAGSFGEEQGDTVLMRNQKIKEIKDRLNIG